MIEILWDIKLSTLLRHIVLFQLTSLIVLEINYHVRSFRRLRKIIPSQLLLSFYKFYVQSKIDYKLSMWGCTTEATLDPIEQIQTFLATVIYIYTDDILTT